MEIVELEVNDLEKQKNEKTKIKVYKDDFGQYNCMECEEQIVDPFGSNGEEKDRLCICPLDNNIIHITCVEEHKQEKHFLEYKEVEFAYGEFQIMSWGIDD